MIKIQIRPRKIRSFVGAPGPRQVLPEAPGADPCEAPSLPSARCKMRCPEMLIIQKMAYTRGCRVYRQRGDTCVLFVRPDRAAESPNIGRKWRARARQLSSECVCPGKSRDFEIAGGGREKGGRSPSGCRIQNAPMPPAQRAAVFNTWFLGRPEIFDCGIWAAPKTRETMHKHMGEGDFRIPNCCREMVLLRIGLGGCFLVQPVLQDEPRRSNGV